MITCWFDHKILRSLVWQLLLKRFGKKFAHLKVSKFLDFGISEILSKGIFGKAESIIPEFWLNFGKINPETWVLSSKFRKFFVIVLISVILKVPELSDSIAEFFRISFKNSGIRFIRNILKAYSIKTYWRIIQFSIAISFYLTHLDKFVAHTVHIYPKNIQTFFQAQWPHLQFAPFYPSSSRCVNTEYGLIFTD